MSWKYVARGIDDAAKGVLWVALMLVKISVMLLVIAMVVGVFVLAFVCVVAPGNGALAAMLALIFIDVVSAFLWMKMRQAYGWQFIW